MNEDKTATEVLMETLRSSVYRCSKCGGILSVMDFEFCPLCDSPYIEKVEAASDQEVEESLMVGIFCYEKKHRDRKALRDSLFGGLDE